MQSTFESACAYEALSSLTYLFFWNAELLPGFDLGRALLGFLTSSGAHGCKINAFECACVYEALSTLTGVLCWGAEAPPQLNLGRALCDCSIHQVRS
jgi:hypothetical protein